MTVKLRLRAWVFGFLVALAVVVMLPDVGFWRRAVGTVALTTAFCFVDREQS